MCLNLFCQALSLESRKIHHVPGFACHRGTVYGWRLEGLNRALESGLGGDGAEFDSSPDFVLDRATTVPGGNRPQRHQRMIPSLSDGLNQGERFMKLEPGINLQAYTPSRKGRNSTVPRRNFGCRLTSNLTLEGFEMVVLENELFRLAVLPGKGTDMIELLHKPTDTDFMWWTALGLRPSHPDLSDFQAQYEGGWQEIFPNLAATHIHDGTKLDAYGEDILRILSP